MFRRRSIAHRAKEQTKQQPIEIIDLTLDSPIRNDDNTTITETTETAVPSCRIEGFVCCGCEEQFNMHFCCEMRNCPHQRCISCAILLINDSPTVAVHCSICNDTFDDENIRNLLTQQEYSHHINKHSIYTALMALEDQSGFIPSSEIFECQICMMEIAEGDGMVIRNCLHTFCIDCIRAAINTSTEAEVKCPSTSCDETIQDREIRSLVTQNEYDKYSIRMMQIMEGQCSNSYHCKTPDCTGWAIVEDNVIFFRCPICTSINCLSCQAIHPGMNCLEHQSQIQRKSDDELTKRGINRIIEQQLGMRCPKCMILIMKRDGCDYLVCAMCRTEICWATKQSRWGPGGRGDTSGGCKCSVVKKCSPSCKNCH